MLQRILPVFILSICLLPPVAARENAQLSKEDTLYVLVRIKGLELVSGDWNHGDYLQHQLVAALKKDFRKKPVEFLFPSDSANAIPTQAQFIIDLNIIELHINEPIITQQNRTVSREVTTNTYSDEAEDSRKQHATVYADLTVSEKSLNAIIRMAVATTRLTDNTTGWNGILAESYKWENKSASYTGSFQALGSKEVELVKSKARNIPTSEQVYRDMIREIFVKNSRKIANNLH